MQIGAPVMTAVLYACSCTLPYSPEGAKAGPLRPCEASSVCEERCGKALLHPGRCMPSQAYAVTPVCAPSALVHGRAPLLARAGVSKFPRPCGGSACPGCPPVPAEVGGRLADEVVVGHAAGLRQACAVGTRRQRLPRCLNSAHAGSTRSTSLEIVPAANGGEPWPYAGAPGTL